MKTTVGLMKNGCQIVFQFKPRADMYHGRIIKLHTHSRYAPPEKTGDQGDHKLSTYLLRLRYGDDNDNDRIKAQEKKLMRERRELHRPVR